ncbi:MAG: hypothetical protein J7501_02020 [Bdellovibrio sp.]|nr:hypothetical protein [Bdellovibrio sp.]
MKKMWLVLALFMGMSATAHAGLMIEPYLGYEMGKTTDPDGKTDFVNMGLRLAYKTPVMLWVGVDGNFGVSGNFKPDSGADATAKRTAYFGVVGIDLPILLRAWAGYGFNNKVVADNPDGEWSGTAMKLGVGFTGLPFISLNLEYTKDTVDKTSGTVIGTDNDLNHDAYMLSVSLPLVF